MRMAKKKKKGRPKQQIDGERHERFNLLLESTPAEWAKHQPGGLSGLVRTLLREAYQRAYPEKR